MLPRDGRRPSHDVTFAAVRITRHQKMIPRSHIGAFVAYQVVVEIATATKVIRALSRSRTIFDFCAYLLMDLQDIWLGIMLIL